MKTFILKTNPHSQVETISALKSETRPNSEITPDFNDIGVTFPASLTTSSGLVDTLLANLHQKVIITIGSTKLNVIICAVTSTLVRAIDYVNTKVIYINLARIDNIEELPIQH
ncbi:hypothetical protein AN641_08020 [Candidatus Epulonipiscioides gigas]|nr:hypothetical protein AN641_08020 [Epulopiscium sp. SCG-C07WGA-EpuloA2]